MSARFTCMYTFTCIHTCKLIAQIYIFIRTHLIIMRLVGSICPQKATAADDQEKCGAGRRENTKYKKRRENTKHKNQWERFTKKGTSIVLDGCWVGYAIVCKSWLLFVLSSFFAKYFKRARNCRFLRLFEPLGPGRPSAGGPR